MNEDYPPNLNLSLSGFQNQNQQPYDSFDMSVEYNDKRAAFDPFSEQPKNSLPPLQSVQSNRVPPPLISSINSANSRNQAGNISGQNDPNRPTTFGGLPPDQHPNQSQSHDRRSHEADNHIFSFRRDHNQASLRQDRNQENIVNIENQATSPTNENGSYEKTRKLVLKLKKCYIFYFLNLLYFGLAIFNLIIAYQNEEITFPRLENIEYQFAQKIVLDLSVVSTSESCKDPYTGTQAGTWPGIKQICKCSSGTFLRACGEADLQAGCEPLGEYKPVTGGSWDGKKICLRKSDKSFFEYYQDSGFMESYSGNLLCPNSQKKCIMSLTKNFICVGRLESCPLTQIDINNDDSQNIARLRAQVALGSKTLAYDTQGSNATTVMDIFIEPDQCSQGTLQDEEKNKYCPDVPQKKLLDSESEYIFLQDNSGWATQDIASFQASNNSMNLYTSPMNYLDMCVFNSTFNPVIVSSQLANWNVVKYLLFINPFFMTTLLVLNILRALMIKYINAPEPDRILQKRKKEIYILFGSSFGSSSLIITGEILTMLYYIFWGYLLLNPDRMLAEKWLAMSCIDSDVKTEIQFMVNQFLKIEAYNMMIIGPMIFGCVMEAIFSQVRLMIRPYSRISRDDSIRE